MASSAGSVEQSWRRRIEAVVSSDELRDLAKPSARDTGAWLTVLWVEIGILIVAANLVPLLPLVWAVPTGLALVLLFATRVNALGVVLHEGSHGLLASSRRANDRISNWGAAWWILNSVEEYRPTHRLHHRYLGEARDPDRPAYLIPARRGGLIGRVVQDLIGVTAVRRAATLLSGVADEEASVKSQTSKRRILVGKSVALLLLFGQFVLVQGLPRGLVFYLVFWLFPLLCLYPLSQRLKNIAEHFDAGLRDPTHRLWIARTSAAGWVQNHLVGARMEYHFEHHVLPTIPYRGLVELHRRLDSAGIFVRNADVLSGGYIQFIAKLRRTQPATNTVGDFPRSTAVSRGERNELGELL